MGPPRLHGHTLTYIGGADEDFLAFGGYLFSGYTLEPEYQTWDFSEGLSNTLHKYSARHGIWEVVEVVTIVEQEGPGPSLLRRVTL